MKAFGSVLVLALALAACGPGPKTADKAGKPPPAKHATALPTGPVKSGVGVVIGLAGTTLTLDHEAVAEGLPAGRHDFHVDAAALAEAPIEPGARVAFTYQDWQPLPLVTELKAR
jgi:hypothetical protein